MNLYRFPEYYEIAFGFRNIPEEVDFFDAAIRKFSRIPVRKVFEVAAGAAPYLEEWYRRGYQYTGLDSSSAMLAAARRKSKQAGIEAELIKGDLKDFEYRGKFDLAYVLLGSLYLETNEEFDSHLDCVARVLRPGGLYVLDGVVTFKLLGEKRQKWTMRRRGISVKTTYDPELIEPLIQNYIEHLTVEISDHGERKVIDSRARRKLFYPQEFCLLIERHKKFEFLDWYKNFRMDGPKDGTGRNCVILRRR